MNDARSHYDIAVVGAGTAGATTAWLLARQGHRVVLIERRATAPSFQLGEGLPPTVAPLLAQLDLLDHADASPHRPAAGNDAAWGGHHVTRHDFLIEHGRPGWHLDRTAFDAHLLQRATAAGADLRRGARVTRATQPCRSGGTWGLDVAHGDATRTLEVRCVVDASGRGAAFVRRLGITRRRDDRLVAFAQRTTRGVADRDDTTLIEAVEDGWWYTAPLPGNQRVVVFLTDTDTESARDARDPEVFARHLTRTHHVAPRLGGAKVEGQPWVAVAGGGCLDRVAGGGWLAVGDAAQSFDPLASQGILTALYGAEHAASAINHALDGDAGAFTRYATAHVQIRRGYRMAYRQRYRAERRFENRLFWQRRHTPST